MIHRPRIAITGATGFLGRYLLAEFAVDSDLNAWYRSTPDPAFSSVSWIQGELNSKESCRNLLTDCDFLIHAALFRPGQGFRGSEGDLLTFADKNILGSLQLFETAKEFGVKRVIFISTCAVHERILNDRPLDEAHPLWPTSFYGAHKAALEKFVHAYGLGEELCFSSLRPTGIYGIAEPIESSKWYSLIRDVVQEKDVTCSRGGKEVHASDVAKACRILLESDEEDKIRGRSFNCYDRYVSEFEVAHIARSYAGSSSDISGTATSPLHEIDTSQLRSEGMIFGGELLLKHTVEEIARRIY